MTRSPRDQSGTEQHVAFAGELARWIERAGVADDAAIGDLAVGFADILHAAASASPKFDELLALDPTDPVEAEIALSTLGYLHALFVTEIKSHAEDLERRWEMLEDSLAARVPAEPADDHKSVDPGV